MPHPNDPKLRSFIDVAPTSAFPIQNLPYGVFSSKDGLAPRVGVAIGDHVLDLWELEQDSRLDVGPLGVFSQPSLNAFMALGPKVWSATRARISELLRSDHPELRDNRELRARALVPMADVKLHMPFAVSGYTDFYSSKEHATNVGVMFRGKDNALQPNWLHMPIGYNGRDSPVVVSGTDLHRPMGQLKGETGPRWAPCERLDLELELGAVVGRTVPAYADAEQVRRRLGAAGRPGHGLDVVELAAGELGLHLADSLLRAAHGDRQILGSRLHGRRGEREQHELGAAFRASARDGREVWAHFVHSFPEADAARHATISARRRSTVAAASFSLEASMPLVTLERQNSGRSAVGMFVLSC